MSESTLSMPMTKLQAEVGDRLGWGRGSTAQTGMGEEAWTASKLSKINDILDTALRWVYHEATVNPAIPPHQWSWLTPSADFVVTEGEKTTLLPQDFAGFASNFLALRQGDSGGRHSKVPLTIDRYLDEKYAANTTVTGRPTVAAERVRRDKNADSSQRSELYVWPTPDATYHLRGAYNLTGESLTSANPYTYGGPTMAACFQAAVRAASEIYVDDLRPGEGPEWQVFQRSLAAAIARDGRRMAKTLGENTDRSDPSRRTRGPWWPISFVDPVTVDDVLYD